MIKRAIAAVVPGHGSCWSATTSRPNRPSGGARVAEPRAVWPPWPSGSRFRPATGASAPTPGSRA